MILKGSQRGGAVQLAKHLMNDHENDHVEIHAINGFLSDDIYGALDEIYAVSRATRCKQFMFSLSLSPPEEAVVTVTDFENAVDESAERLGLTGQPYVMLFHEKNGRRHCHAVFSRIDPDKMRAINLPFYKERLNELAKELYLTHGWELPNGFKDHSLSDPLNYTLEEYQVAKQAARDPREIKTTLKKCWQYSDNKRAFTAALKEKGFYLSKGDRRGFVALDWQGNVYSLSRWLNERGKALKAKLGEPEHLPSVDEMQQHINDAMGGKHVEFQSEIKTDYARKLDKINSQRDRMVESQRDERQALRVEQTARQHKEAIERSSRLRKGLSGLWDWVSGKRKEIIKSNARQLKAAQQDDQMQLLALVQQHQGERRKLHGKFTQQKRSRESVLKELDVEFKKWTIHKNLVAVDRVEIEQSWYEYEPMIY